MRFNLKTASLVIAILPMNSFAVGLDDDPLLTYFKADEFGWRDSGEETSFIWDVDTWIGKDLGKLWIKSSGERVLVETETSETELLSSETELLYSIGVASFWDLQLGLRRETNPDWSDNSLGARFFGTAPYLLEIDASLFVNEDNLTNARIEVEYEYLFTQKLVLMPRLEVSLYSDDDAVRGIGSGLSDAELGLRLHYELIREFAPYIDINYEQKFGETADFLSDSGQELNDTQVTIGVSFWF